MRIPFFPALCLLAGLAAPARADSLNMPAGLVLNLSLPGPRWVLSTEVPEILVPEMVEHLEHEMQAQGRSLSKQELETLARKRLSQNEAFVHNPKSGAVLLIDFSPLEKGEEAPADKTVAYSARYAAESMEQEEGATEVVHSSGEAFVQGARTAHSLSVNYRHHGEPTRFYGIVGFAPPSWFFLYYTDHLRDPADQAEMDAILKSIRISRP